MIGWKRDDAGNRIEIPREHLNYPGNYIVCDNVPPNYAEYVLPTEELERVTVRPFYVSDLYAAITIEVKDLEIERMLYDAWNEGDGLFQLFKNRLDARGVNFMEIEDPPLFLYLVPWPNKMKVYDILSSVAHVWPSNRSFGPVHVQ